MQVEHKLTRGDRVRLYLSRDGGAPIIRVCTPNDTVTVISPPHTTECHAFLLQIIQDATVLLAAVAENHVINSTREPTAKDLPF